MKELSINTDYYDNVCQRERFYTEDNIRDMMAYCRRLGATTVDWIYDDMWSFYEDHPGGFDLMQVAVDAAHAEGLRIHAVYKPWEGSLTNVVLPQALPIPEDAIVWRDLRGIAPTVRPFIARHPDLCLARWPGDHDTGGNVTSIRLIKNNAAAVQLEAGRISIYTSRVNGTFERYAGRFQVESSVEWRPIFPLGSDCRIITLSGLDIPESASYVEIRFADGAFGGEAFHNDFHDLVELLRADGSIVPSTTAAIRSPGDSYAQLFSKPLRRQLSWIGKHPELNEVLDDPERLSRLASETRDYARAPSEQGRLYQLEERGLVSVARGKVPYLPGRLNPVYPQVREEWLRTVRRLIDHGVDAIDFRPGEHFPPQETWAYGFNPPVLERLGGRFDIAGAKRIIGEAYTGFLREARDLLHAHDKQIGVHLFTTYLVPRDEGLAGPNNEMMEYEWETWVREIADFAQLRGAMGLRECSLRYCLDRFGDACLKAGIPLTYQSNRRFFAKLDNGLNLPETRLKGLEHEMDLALGHPAVTAYQLYETAYFSDLDDDYRFQGNQQVHELCRRRGFPVR